ncbi:MAG: DUF488 domain-containing protein [Steroidobacteraceae bacterium]
MIGGLEPAYFPTVKIFTVGYEGLELEDFLRQLRRARVWLVVDVRDMPVSRKRGFSKAALAKALGAAGMAYLHVRNLGCPKVIRDQYRADRDWNAYTAAFMKHLRKQSQAVRELADLCEERSAALLCYETDAGLCHRTYVARAVAAMSGGSVLHIGTAGITPDRGIPAAA